MNSEDYGEVLLDTFAAVSVWHLAFSWKFTGRD